MLVNTLYRLYECWEIHKMMPQDTKLWKPSMFFLIIYSYSNIGFNLTLWISLWKKQRHIQDICLLLIENRTLRKRHNHNKIQNLLLSNIAIIFWALMFGIVGLVNFSEDNYVLFSKKYTLLNFLNTLFNENLPFDCRFSVADLFAGIFEISSFNIRQIVGLFEEFFITIIILAVWMKIYCVLNPLKYQSPTDKIWGLLKHNYSLVKQMVDAANSVIQYNLLLHTIVVLFSYTFQFAFQFGAQTYFTKNSPIHKVRFAIFLINSLFMYYLAADINHKVTKQCLILIL